ncbi:4Fe-4S dicluster domain-containing protein [Alkalithermobacter thermoalcaliphilus JW-YL-7 = DSM 7308]|uniref:4Fe-4S dicluster domain-containing protein n=1 Tax=Alkalithermobacter thermoalcaliphilus JW-YL-7 = DSM 7308 TaxID=1121328 RepID=A0A150FRL0_CLOPD|nr:Flavodoxin domain containing protein [[Clostridium] paradoxum JW-YL-7 = DSM 7308]SHK41273.1 4Fe-4S dicluster domain-containing protein [[Clostridium] paradoxum JW-YL-7 = DSM 7308]
MRGAVVYFSGTGNTEYVAKLFQNELNNRGYEITLIDVSKTIDFRDDYSFFVFGSCIHAEMFPIVFMDWVKKNIKQGNNRKCIVFSTQAANTAAGANVFADELKDKGFDIRAVEHITMPNNYYLVGFGKDSQEKKDILKQQAKQIVKKVADDFVEGKMSIKTSTKFRNTFGKMAYFMFLKYSKTWAKKKISVDTKLCIKCMKCIKDCPTENIYFEDEIKFKDKCISCQRCLHSCPVNAFKYKGKHFEKYTI